MHLKVRKPTKLTIGTKVAIIRPHDAAIRVPDTTAKRLLNQHPDRFRKVGPTKR